MKENAETIDITPTWETAVSIYINVLQNPGASFEGIEAAKEELLRLARIVDNLRANKN